VKILITSANSAAAHQLKNKLSDDTVIILGDYLELPDFMLKTGNMIRLPDPKSGSYSHQMLTLCLDSDITAIYPLREEEAVLLKEAEQLFKEYNISINM
jgi:hypothetical protein